MTQRLVKHPFLAIFDGPDTNTSTDIRSLSTVPSQALFLLNNPFVQEQAGALAERLIRSTTETRRRIDLAWELAWNRPPTASEVERAGRYLQEYALALSDTGAPADRHDHESWTSLAKILITANEFLYIE
jgi:hypothetical protein